MHLAFINGVAKSGDEPIEDLVADVEAGGAKRWAAIAALGESSDPRAYDMLVQYAASPDWTLRAAAVAALSQRADGARAQDLIRARLHDESPYVVRAACQAAAALHLTTLHADILQLLTSHEPATRQTAIAALDKLWEASDSALVLSMHREDSDEQVRRDAAWVLRHHADQQLAATLVSLWVTDPLPRHRTWACELVAEFDGPQIREMVAPLVADPDGHVRAAARRAIGASDPAT